jgi:hypothetical protein
MSGLQFRIFFLSQTMPFSAFLRVRLSSVGSKILCSECRTGEKAVKLSELGKVFPTACMVVQAFIPTHRQRQIISSVLVALLFESSAHAQTGDWQAVENLRTSSYILVKTQRRYRCSVESVTEDNLICVTHLPRSSRLFVLTIPRSEIREVRLLPHPDQAEDARIGAVIGAGAGAIANASATTGPRGANALFGGLAGAGLGALIGAFVPVFQVAFQRSKLIYKV